MYPTKTAGARAASLLLLVALASSPLLASGRAEPDPPPERPPSGAADLPAETQSDREATNDETARVVPMDEATAESVFSLGMMPFEEKIPSENFTLKLLDGGEVSLSDYRGSVVFLNFWATWCPPCREEMPSMQALYDELADEGLEILAVNVLEDEATAAVFIDEQGFTYPVLMDRNGRVMLRYGVRAYPTTYLIDRDGFVIGVRPGFHDWATDGLIESMRGLLATE